ncbi:hypothetical protein F4678DRAFT_436840 [Xylaria arbuscula]|nr:hypothetical protein F4678DRAFT_436840 [Xylaria arbuscula]
MSGHLPITSLNQNPLSSNPSNAIRCQNYRAAFSRNYSCSYTERAKGAVVNWNTKGYDPDAPHPVYGKVYGNIGHVQHATPKSYPAQNRAQSTSLSRMHEFRSDVKGKGKSTFQGMVGSRDVEYGATNLNQRIDTWLQAGEPSKSVNREWYGYYPAVSGASSTSTFQSDLFDKDNIRNRWGDEKKTNDGLGTDLFAHPVPFNSHLTLPCEFAAYRQCGRVFDIDAVDDWIEHIMSDHLQGMLPPKCICWFCDDFVFDIKTDFDSRSTFENRMWHIRGHIVEEGNAIPDIRPDYYLLDHAHRHKAISTEMYNMARKYSEIPRPGHVCPFDFNSPEAERHDELSKRIIVDQAKEDRMRRRRIPRSKEKAARERYQARGLRTGKLGETELQGQASEAVPQFGPLQVDSHNERKIKVFTQYYSKAEKNITVSGLPPLDRLPDDASSLNQNKIRHFGHREKDPLPSKTQPTFVYNHPLSPPSHQSNGSGRSSLAITITSADDNSKKSKTMYSFSMNQYEGESYRAYSVDSFSPTGRSRSRTRKTEEQTPTNIFSVALSRTHRNLSERFSRLRLLLWPRRPHHLVRVSWICRCGHPLYIDVRKSETENAISFAKAASGSSGSASSITVSGISTGGTSPTQTSSSVSSPTTHFGASTPGTTGPASARAQPSNIFIPPVLAPGTKKYLLLCVNTGHYEIKLEQIDLTNIVLDVSLFGLIRDKYESMRGPRMKNFFMAPKTIEYIKFELVRRSSTGECVGNYERNSIPTQVEVAKKECSFSPCPPRIGSMPIQPHVFMHSFLYPGDHLGELALLQLPKKVGRKLKCSVQPHHPSDVPYGWGIYIVEGPNTVLVSLIMTGVIMLVTLTVLLWSTLRGDVQGGTGIGRYGLAVMATAMAIGALCWEPLRDLAY